MSCAVFSIGHGCERARVVGPKLIWECKQVICVQNQGWMAKWGKESATTDG
jgi:hypothetical protein